MDTEDIDRLKARAELCLEAGDIEGAREVYEGLRDFGRDDPSVFVRLGDLSVRLGDKLTAIEDYRQAAEAYAAHDSTLMVVAVGQKLLNVAPSHELVECIMTPLLSGLAEGSSPGPEVKTPEAKASEPQGPQPQTESPQKPPPPEAEEDEEDEGLSFIFEPPDMDEDVAAKGSAEDNDVYENLEIIENLGDERFTAAGEEDEGEGEEAGGNGILSTPLFSDLSPDELMGIMKRLKTRSYKSGDYIFRKFDIGTSIFVVVSGEAEEVGYTKYEEEVRCAHLTPGSFFGEYEYFSGARRRTVVRALTDLELLEIERNEMAALAAEHPYVSTVLFDFYKERILDKAFAFSKLFKHLSAPDRKELLKHVRVETVPEGTEVLKEGDKGDCMYLVVSGSAKVWKSDGKGGKKTLAKLNESDYFGEVAVMLNRERVSNVTAITTLDMIAIDKSCIKAVVAKYPVVGEVLESIASRHVS